MCRGTRKVSGPGWKMPRSVNDPPLQSNTQQAAILRLLIDARGAWVPLPEIMACAAQYNARVFELRRTGFNVENRTEHVDGVRHSWFRLVNSSTPAAPESVKEKVSPADPGTLESGDWYERQTGKPRPVTATSDLPLFAEGHQQQ